jgi:hypothetical protein
LPLTIVEIRDVIVAAVLDVLVVLVLLDLLEGREAVGTPKTVGRRELTL